MPTNLLINAKWQTQKQVTGVQRYAQGLAHALDHAGVDVEYVQPRRTGRVSGMIWEQHKLPNLAKHAESLLCPANMAPPNLHSDVRLFTVIHCLRFRYYPQSYSRLFVRWYERMIPKIIDRSDVIFTVSQHQLAEIESNYPSAIGKMRVLPPGLDAEFHPNHPRDVAVPDVPYLIFLGNASPAKNVQTLLEAYALDLRLPPLVLVGVTQDQVAMHDPELAQSRVVALGHVNDVSRVAALIANAKALVAPSIYESFGLPCLEAMGCSTPVFASDIPAHREVCDDAVIFVQPTDPRAWADTLTAALEDEGQLEHAAQRGRERAKHWSWSRSIDTFLPLLDEQAGSSAL